MFSNTQINVYNVTKLSEENNGSDMDSVFTALKATLDDAEEKQF